MAVERRKIVKDVIFGPERAVFSRVPCLYSDEGMTGFEGGMCFVPDFR
jgi:hypothetical protein